MANKKNWLGILVIVLVFGMTVVGCDNGRDDDDDDYYSRPFLEGQAEIDNYHPVVGETITARLGNLFNAPNPIGNPSWTWYKTQEEDVSSLSQVVNKTSIGYSSTYTVKQSDVGFCIWAEVSYSGNRGTKAVSTGIVSGIPATANVSVSIRATYFPSRSSSNHLVIVTLTLSDGRWNNVSYSTASQWVTISGTPLGSISVYARGRYLEFSYWLTSETTLPISLTATLNTAQLDTMRSSTNVYNSLTAGIPATVSVSQWTISDY